MVGWRKRHTGSPRLSSACCRKVPSAAAKAGSRSGCAAPSRATASASAGVELDRRGELVAGNVDAREGGATGGPELTEHVSEERDGSGEVVDEIVAGREPCRAGERVVRQASGDLKLETVNVGGAAQMRAPSA